MMGFLDRDRASSAMRERGIDALLLLTPENVFYCTGFSSMLFDLYRKPLMSAVLVPAEPILDVALLVNDRDVPRARTMTGLERVYGFAVFMGPGDALPEQTRAAVDLTVRATRPEQYDRREITGRIAQMLDEQRLGRARVGLELSYLDVEGFALLKEACPNTTFVDATVLMYDLRAVKYAAEIDALRKACVLTEAGIKAAAGSVSRGARVSSVTEAFHTGVWSAAREQDLEGPVRVVLGQPDIFGPGASEHPRHIAAPSSTVKFDVQVAYRKYHSDVGRTFVLGGPTASQTRVYSSLLDAQSRACEAMRPGARISDVFAAATAPLWAAGFTHYHRGHCGHSVGLDPCIEEPPFLSPVEQRRLEPGMVFAVERAFVLPEVGGFHIEDMVLITESGAEILSTLPRDLGVLG
jgi:Xaa-Pro aminopeptidase